MIRNKDLIAACGLALLAALLVWINMENSLLRLLFGLPLALYLPGYTLQAAAFSGPNPGRLERFLLALGSSLIITTLGGLLLDRTQWGLSGGAWAFLLLAITLAASLIAVRRRRREASGREGWEGEPAWFDARQVALIGLAALVVVLAIWIGRAPAAPQGIEGYSLLWLLPSEGNDPQVVQLGVLSQELNPISYRLVVRSAGNRIANWDSISLEPGETWNTTLDLPPDFPAQASLEATLYLSDQPDTPYRTVRLDRSAQP